LLLVFTNFAYRCLLFYALWRFGNAYLLFSLLQIYIYGLGMTLYEAADYGQDAHEVSLWPFARWNICSISHGFNGSGGGVYKWELIMGAVEIWLYHSAILIRTQKKKKNSAIQRFLTRLPWSIVH
jgi:hypothetical protein